jgi:hypothetical protein
VRYLDVVVDAVDDLPPELRFPDASDQDALLSALRHLVNSQGALTLVRSPILDADPSWFPDSYEPGPRGFRTLARRLLGYCGLTGRRVTLRVESEANYSAFSSEGHGQWASGAAAWFEGIDALTCRFGVNARELRDPAAVVGSLCHEVAHAWRAERGIRAIDPVAEEMATDLTAVYLGFGVHLLNSSSTYRTGHYAETGEQLSYERVSRGYLTPGQIALLLAAQVVARDAPQSERRRVARALAPNQRGLFERGYDLLAEDPIELRARIGVPEPPWPEGIPLQELTAPLDADESDLVPAEEDASVEARAGEHMATRLARNRVGFLAFVGALIPFLASLIFNDFQGVTFAAAVAGAALLGGLVGHFLSSWHCSRCGGRLRAEQQRCASCGALLQADDALEEEEPEEGELELGEGLALEFRGKAIRCPRCQWQPGAEALWQCSCGFQWNTFTTRGVCPHCSKAWQVTDCPNCEQRSPHHAWYAPGADGRG